MELGVQVAAERHVAVESAADFDFDRLVAEVADAFDPRLMIVPADDVVIDLDAMSFRGAEVETGAGPVEPEPVARAAEANPLVQDLRVGAEVEFASASSRARLG